MEDGRIVPAGFIPNFRPVEKFRYVSEVRTGPMNMLSIPLHAIIHHNLSSHEACVHITYITSTLTTHSLYEIACMESHNYAVPLKMKS